MSELLTIKALLLRAIELVEEEQEEPKVKVKIGDRVKAHTGEIYIVGLKGMLSMQDGDFYSGNSLAYVQMQVDDGKWTLV